MTGEILIEKSLAFVNACPRPTTQDKTASRP